ncbi:unannotated protein [freshwater metagenome]|uniref:Unannotated protein n=1 Tax=freshwater metagenome TaxID=449393 RepID=A0A6J6Y5I1_9ZZZZ
MLPLIIVEETIVVGLSPSSTASSEVRNPITSTATNPTAIAAPAQVTESTPSPPAANVSPIMAASDEPSAANVENRPARSRTNNATAGVHASARPARGPSKVRNIVPAATSPTT